MTMLTRKSPKPTYQKVLQAVKALPLAEQRRLRDELAKMVGVQLVRPSGSQTAVQRGRRLAKSIQAELASTATGTLDETMIRLRGRSWS